MQLKDVVSRNLVWCYEIDSVHHAAEVMKHHHVGMLPVLQGEQERVLVGVITDRDICIRAVAGRKTPFTPVSMLMSRTPLTCFDTDTLDDCRLLMTVRRLRRIPIVNLSRKCVGIVSLSDVARYSDADQTRQVLLAISGHSGEGRKDVA